MILKTASELAPNFRRTKQSCLWCRHLNLWEAGTGYRCARHPDVVFDVDGLIQLRIGPPPFKGTLSWDELICDDFQPEGKEGG
jgi:hypothetical protein